MPLRDRDEALDIARRVDPMAMLDAARPLSDHELADRLALAVTAVRDDMMTGDNRGRDMHILRLRHRRRSWAKIATKFQMDPRTCHRIYRDQISAIAEAARPLLARLLSTSAPEPVDPAAFFRAA
jgi:AraC-like DNA-binding protein